jgi:SAM-dependent MidA family methyltransferase
LFGLGTSEYPSCGTMMVMAPPSPPNAQSWFQTWLECAYGADGFWRRHRPDEHFRTAATTSPLLADALAEVADRLSVPEVVDVGAGSGQLLSAMADLRPSLRLAGIDLRPRPESLSARIAWAEDLWDVRYGRWTSGQAEGLLAGDDPVLLIAAEWLDDLPCPIVHREADGWREIVVDEAGNERPGPRLAGAELDWADRWWTSGRRAEIGATRDKAWSALASVVRHRGGGLVLLDYGHDRDNRPVDGSFAAYRNGHLVPPTPSSEVNLTAHVSLDAVRAAGESAGLRTALDVRQDEALTRLLAAAPTDADPLRDLARRSERAALGSAYGWGTHRWLVQVPH